jgi:hypothetical protein
MSTKSTERMRERHRRGARREVQVTIVLHEDDLAEIANRGYEGAASTDPKLTLMDPPGQEWPEGDISCHPGTFLPAPHSRPSI